jgi:exodeoxyribonuclease V gamma subunit
MEELSRALAEVVRVPAGARFEPEIVVVQSKGMERWVGLEMSRRLGVWANARFPFPRAFVDELLDTVLDEPAEARQRWERDSLTWTVARLLPELAQRPGFALVARNLEDDPNGTQRHELARRIADTFDQYTVFRPELVAEWEGGAGDDWQAVLFRAVVGAIGPHHLAARARRFSAFFQDERGARLPARACWFGLSSLPPIHVSLLARLAERSEVHLFMLSPSQEYWAEIRSKRELWRAARAAPEGELHLSEGNPLLASLGRSGRDFQRVLESVVDYADAGIARSVDPGKRTLLAALQSDVLSLTLRGDGPGRAPRLSVTTEDDSIEVHSCHGPMREIEVLRDRLLLLFDTDPTLEPHDVVVMMPDVDRYAPLVDAVFGVEPGSPSYVPYRIADRSVRADSEVAGALLAVIATISGRFKASEILDLLQLEPVRLRFGIEAEDVARIQRWVHASGVRWGVDAEDRHAAGQPPISEHTWRFGLSRLLLGWAMPGHGTRLFAGALPYDDVEGEAAEVIGRLAELAETLMAARERLAAPRPMSEWKIALGELASATLAAPPKEDWQLRRVRETIAEIAARAELADFCEPVTLEVVSSLVAERLETDRTTHDFLTGGVTFCALLPMRSIPFRVVCLVGLSDEDFPRRDRRAAFDLVGRDPRPGDRSLRDEDRYLFLEALLAARERLIVTYVGRGIQDDRPRPPSVVVGELLDAIDDGFCLAPATPEPRGKRRSRRVVPEEQMALPFAEAPRSEGRRPSERIVLAHPLQPFSPRYFGGDDDPRLVSYASDEAEGARALARAKTRLLPFVREALAEPDRAASVDVDQLARFFENPARGFLRRLGVDLEERAELVQDREPIDPGALEQYDVGQRLVERALRGESIPEAESLLRAEGLLPIGSPGRAWFAELAPEAETIARAARALGGADKLGPHPLEIVLGETRVTGTLGGLFCDAQLRCSYSRLKAKNLIALWIRHLALCAAPPAGHPRRSVLVGRPRGAGERGVACGVFGPVDRERAEHELARLLALYRVGQTFPLALFPASAEAYAVRARAGDVEAALAAAKKTFEGDFGFGESKDPSVERLFADTDPFDPARAPSFEELARAVFDPLSEHLTEGT